MIEQAIEHAEEVAIEQEYLMGRYDAASGYTRSGNEAIRTESAKKCEKCATEHRQLAAWLRELQELRKSPRIIYCSECTHFKDNGSTVGYCKRKAMYQFTDYFCGDAERRTDGQG